MIRTATLLTLFLVVAGCGGSGGGSVPLRQAAPPPKPAEVEPNDLPAQALDLGTGTSALVTGSISSTGSAEGLPTGDLDHFRFTPSVTGRLTVTLATPEGSDFDLGLLRADGVRVATARSTRSTEVLHARVDQDQPIVLQAGGYSGRPGTYELRLEITAFPDPTGWPAPSPMNEARCFHGMAALPGGGAVVGGGTKNAGSPEQAFLGGIGSMELFDPETGEFTVGPDLAVTRFGVTATALPDGRVLFAGGDLAGTAMLYNPETGQMEGGQIPLSNRMRALHTATLLKDGRVLFAGGARIAMAFPPTAEKLNTLEVFDPKSAGFTRLPNLASLRFSHAACLLADGRVLITGGERNATSEIIDPANLSAGSTPGPALTANRDDHTATLLQDGRVLLTGGQNWGGGTLDTAEILDDVTAEATSAFRMVDSRMTTKRSDHVALLPADGKVLLLGGELDTAGQPDAILTAVDRFDPATETFTAMPDLKSGRDDHRAEILEDGRVLVTGGEDEAMKAIPDVEAYGAE